ncbi:MAG TPA: hypothetical protein VMU24_05535 [Candidatus Acidoferrales bacterium]|nr:hypothetical protein [Candidatus Acidoferrales bacterium]
MTPSLYCLMGACQCFALAIGLMFCKVEANKHERRALPGAPFAREARR